MATAIGIQNQVRRYLREMGLIFDDRGDGSFTVGMEHANISLTVVEFGDHGHVLRFSSFTNWELPYSTRLVEYVAEAGYVIGGVSLCPTDEGSFMVEYHYAMLANGLSFTDVVSAFNVFAGTALTLGDEIQGRFGGELYFEPRALPAGSY
ncbi:hypothetical protein [Kineococcus glutinatus]|uniref:Sensory transduction regulator n=1 Tax=Kineococcus glutinatus TaxID=1070872 RepID=A0ABP9HEE1_9ACTN